MHGKITKRDRVGFAISVNGTRQEDAKIGFGSSGKTVDMSHDNDGLMTMETELFANQFSASEDIITPQKRDILIWKSLVPKLPIAFTTGKAL